MASVTFESGHTDMVHDAQLDYYGRRLASCSSDKTIRIFDVAGDQRLHLADLKGHEGPVWQVAWAHPKFGTILASCSFDHRVIVWKEVHDGHWAELYRSPPTMHTASINSIAWAPVELGLVLACASSDGSISIIEHKQDTQNWEIVKVEKAHSVGCTAVSWAPGAPSGSLVSAKPPGTPVKRLVTAGCDNTAKIWKCTEHGWETEQVLQGHKDWVRDAAWAPNLGLPMSNIATASQDGKVFVWTEQPNGSWTYVVVCDLKVPVWRVSWSLTGNILAVADGSNAVTLWKETMDGHWQQIVQ